MPKSRACDRCWSLKTLCDGNRPCSRCVRLQQECESQRPKRQRGRPRKIRQSLISSIPPSDPPPQNTKLPDYSYTSPSPSAGALAPGHHDPRSPSLTQPPEPDILGSDGVSPDDSHQRIFNHVLNLSVGDISRDATPLAASSPYSIGDVFQPDNPTIEDLGLDQAAIARLLSQCFSPQKRSGIFCILPPLQDLPWMRAGSEDNEDGMTGRNVLTDLTCALLAVALQAELAVQPMSNDKELLIDMLRVEALRPLPILTWKSRDFNREQVLVLLFLSHTWCMREALTEISYRWSSLARVIWQDLRHSDQSFAEQSGTPSSLITNLIEVQEVTMMLLRHEPPSANRVVARHHAMGEHTATIILDSEINFDFVHLDITSQASAPGKRYFGFFLPLASSLQKVISDGREARMGRLLNEHEQYFLKFPTQLLQYASLTHGYEAEAMMWFHGIFMLSYVDRDLIDLLFDPACPSRPEFYSALEHGILLGEAIPSILRLDPNAEWLSPATVFFVLLSSTAHATALWQYHAVNNDNLSTMLVQEIPQTLSLSATSHLRLLDLFCRQGCRFDNELTQAIRVILLSLVTPIVGSAMSALSEALFTLSHYRWRGSGSGIVKLSDACAAREWNHDSVTWTIALRMVCTAAFDDIEFRRDAIQAICQPEARICTPGYFDLSMRLVIDQHSSATSGDLWQPSCDTFGLMLSGTDNQSFWRLARRCSLAFEAINGLDDSLLQLILPYVFGWPTILHGLLALSMKPSSRTPQALEHHQTALSELRLEMGRLYEGEQGELDTASVHKVLCSSFLLAMFSLAECDGCWAQHVQGMVSIIRMAGWNTLHSSKLGVFLLSSCAHQDISAFAVGRSQLSRKCWLGWMSQKKDRHEDTFSAFEILTGYPESLVSIIARISEAAEDNFSTRLQHRYYDYQSVASPQTDLSTNDIVSPSVVDAATGLSTRQRVWGELELSLANWTAPPLPSNLSDMARFILPVAWETIRYAAFIYHWRGYGFHSNILEQIRQDRRGRRDFYVQEIISNTRMILNLAHSQQLTIGNAMLWSLSVAGCECANEPLRSHRSSVLELLKSLQTLFCMEHTARLRDLLQALWQSAPTGLTDRHARTEGSRPLSLENMARDRQLVVPLM